MIARLAALACMLALAAPAARAQGLVADIAEHLISVTTGFDGAEVVIFGTVQDAAADLVIIVRGPDAQVEVRRKRRTLGIWHNAKPVGFDDVPGYYATISNRPAAEIASRETRARQRIGLDVIVPVERATRGVKRRDAADIAAHRDALIEGRRREGLYVETVGATDGARPIVFVGGGLFRASHLLPKTAPLGAYQVQVLQFRDGRPVAAQTTPLIVSKDGVNADIVDFAGRYPWGYAILAVLVAAGAGWGAATALRRA